MANIFFLAFVFVIGIALPVRYLADTVRLVEQRDAAPGCCILLPEDPVVADELKPGVPTRTVSVSAVPPRAKILDIEPKTAAVIEQQLGEARTLVWNGPVGAF